MAPDIQMELRHAIAFDQETFFANTKNKQQFINHLADCLSKAWISVVKAAGDADTDIIAAPLTIAKTKRTNVVVFADDTDILALLLHHRQNCIAEMFFLSFRR
jgi:hypothetical protein